MTKTKFVYVPVLPYPPRSGLVQPRFGYDCTTQLPYVLKIAEDVWMSDIVDTVWGVEGFGHGDIIILLPQLITVTLLLELLCSVRSNPLCCDTCDFD